MEQSYVIRNDRVIGKTVPNINYNYSTCPIGSIFAFSSERIPLGFFICDGASYKVAEYPDLYAVIGNTYGGDTENFNVPNLVDKFIQGSTTSGTEKEAGLPNITGYLEDARGAVVTEKSEGALTGSYETTGGTGRVDNGTNSKIYLDASKSNAIYGNSDTVQPPALTMVYIIKAFHTNEGVDEGVSDDVVDYVDNKLSSVDIKTTVTIPAGQYLKVELGENKLSTVLLSMKTTIGTGYTTFLISNYGIGTDARCKVQQLQGERKFAKYIDGCDLYITPSVADQVWYASAISVQGVNPVLSASETYSGTEITTNSVPKEIVDGLISDTKSSATSTYSSSKIDEKYGAYTFGTAEATQWLKLTLGNSSKFQPITITDQYGGKVEITGMADDGTYKSVKLVRYSYGDWTTYSATDYTTTSQGDANYKIRRLYYYPTNGCYYLEIRQWCTIKVSGTTTKPEMVTSLPAETSAMTSIPESMFATKKDIDGTAIQTTTTTDYEYYAITYGDSISTAYNQGILIQYNRLNFPPSTYIFSTTSYVTDARETVSVAKISNNFAGKSYDLRFYIDKDNKTMYLKMPSYSRVSLQDLAFKSKAVAYTKVDAVPSTATVLAVAEYVTKEELKTSSNVEPTTIPFTGNATYFNYADDAYVKYEVVNGICYFQISTIVNAIATSFAVITNGLPKPSYERYFSFTPFDNKANNLTPLQVYIDTTGAIKGSMGVAGNTYMITGSYPTA